MSDERDSDKRVPISRTPIERQEMLAMMLATGRFTIKKISELLNISPPTIRTLRDSPLFQQLVKKYQAEIYSTVIDKAFNDVLADAEHNVDWMKKVRDGEIVDEAKNLSVRLRAASWLGDRQLPVKRDDGTEAGVKIVINTDIRDRFSAADKELEDQAIEIEAEEVDE